MLLRAPRSSQIRVPTLDLRASLIFYGLIFLSTLAEALKLIPTDYDIWDPPIIPYVLCQLSYPSASRRLPSRVSWEEEGVDRASHRRTKAAHRSKKGPRSVGVTGEAATCDERSRDGPDRDLAGEATREVLAGAGVRAGGMRCFHASAWREMEATVV